MHLVNMKRILIFTVASAALALSSLNSAAADVTNTITLSYEGLGLANGDPIPTPYPGITASANVNHMGVDGGKNAIAQDVTFQGSGYGNLNNVAVSPTVTSGFGMITIIPTDPNSYLRLISCKIATKDDGLGDEVNVNFYINEVFGTTTNFIAPARTEALVAGDAVPTTHTVHTFGGTPVTGLPGRGFEILLDARNGRLALDDFKFEVVSPSSERIIVTLPGQTFTPGVGNENAPSAQVAGVSFPLTLTAVTNNGLGNPVIDISYAGAKTIAYSGPGGTPIYTTSVNFTAGQATGVTTTLKKAETTTITATETGVRPGVASSSLTVGPGAFTKLQVLAPGETAVPGNGTGKTGAPSNQSVGTPFNVTVNAVDANWNLVTTAPADNIHVATSDPADTEPGDNSLAGGTRTFSITPETLGTLTVMATNTTQPGSITAGTSSSIAAVAGSVVYPYTLTYDGLGVANNAPIPEPYPGIAAATVTHFGRDSANPYNLFEDVFFSDGVSPDRYGDLLNVAKGPLGTPTSGPAWGGVRIVPNSPSNHVRLISFKLATLDDNDFNEGVSVAIYDPHHV
jgi:hypothetical protein